MVNLLEIVPIVEGAIGIVRNNPDPDEPTPSDSYLAYAIVNELRRAGLKLVLKDDPGSDICETTHAVTIPNENAGLQKAEVHCCDNMAQSVSGLDGFGYRKSRHVEYHPDIGSYAIADDTGAFSLAIRYCPWCGTELPELAIVSVEPGDELVLPDDPAITEECMAILRVTYSDMIERIRFGRPLLTRGSKSDWVWRIDYVDPESKTTRWVNRIMCFRNKQGQMNVAIAVGQQVDPLHHQS